MSKEKKDRVIRTFSPKIQSMLPQIKHISLSDLNILNEMLLVKPNFSPKATDFPEMLIEYIGYVSESQAQISE